MVNVVFYPTDPLGEAVRQLTHKKTINRKDMDALAVLGIKCSLIQENPDMFFVIGQTFTNS